METRDDIDFIVVRQEEISSLLGYSTLNNSIIAAVVPSQLVMRSRLLIARQSSSLPEELKNCSQVSVRDVRTESPAIDMLGLVQDEWVTRSLF